MESVTNSRQAATSGVKSPVDIARETGGTPLRKLLAILMANGVTESAEQARILGLTIRAVQKAKANHSSPEKRTTVRPKANHSSPKRTTVRPKANHSSPKRTTVRLKSEPQFAEANHSSPRARVEDITTFFSFGESEKKKKDPPPPKTDPKPNLRLLALEAFHAWNDTALLCGLPQAAKLTPGRVRSIVARLTEYGLDGWKQALANIERSSFLTGTNDRGWKADLDFLCQARSFGKVHDGGFGNGRHAQSAGLTAAEIAAARKAAMQAEMELDAALRRAGA